MSSSDERLRVLLVDRAGYHRYRLSDGRPALDPAEFRVSLLTMPQLAGQPGPGECAEVFGFDIDDEPMTAAMITTLYQQAPIDRIIVFPENLLLPVAQVRAALGISGPGPDEIVRFRDKPTMKRTATAAGIPVADWLAVDSADQARPLLQRHGKIVLKPRDGAGSAGVHTVASVAELEALTADVTGYQAEGFIEAPMIHTDAIVRQGAVVVSRTSRYLASTLSHTARKPLGSVVVDDPGLLAPAQQLLTEVIEAFAVKDAVLHLEAFVTTQGLVFNEVAARAGGGGIVALLQALTGHNLFEAMIRMSLEQEPAATHEITAPSGGFVLMYGDAGVLEAVDDAHIPAEWIIERKLAVAVGQRFAPVGRAGGSLVSYIVRGPDEQEVTRRIRTIQDTVRIVIRGDRP